MAVTFSYKDPPPALPSPEKRTKFEGKFRSCVCEIAVYGQIRSFCEKVA